MEVFDLKLVEEVRKHRNLYDTDVKEYNDIVSKTVSWKEIAQNMESDVKKCKKKWRYMRESFVRMKRKVKRNGGDMRYENACKYTDPLAWLTPYIRHRRGDM